jgi:hypothetical protein
MDNKRILKTGLLAVVVTVAFAVFVFRMAEWSRGLNSDAVALGQRTGAGTCSATSTGAFAESVKVVPQIALSSFDGGLTKYSTIIQIINTSGAAQTVSANFYKEDGTPLDNASLAAGSGFVTTGVMNPTSIPKDGILVISGGGTTDTGVLGWGKVISCGAASVTTFFELRDGRTNVLYGRIGAVASPPNLSSFIIPRIREIATQLDVGFAVVNTAESGSATLMVDLIDGEGNSMKQQSIELAARSKKVQFAAQLFALPNERPGRSYQYLKFTSTSPTIAAVALGLERDQLTGFPVDVLD